MKRRNESHTLAEREFIHEEGWCLPYLSFEKLEEIPFVRHMFTTRGGGVSTGEYESLNLSFTRGDDAAAVEENFRRVAAAMGTDFSHIVTSDQTHTTTIRRVTAADMGKGILYKRDYSDVDGLITNEAGILLATFYADCVPLYFVDTKRHAIGLSHSGWRGTVAGMAQSTIRQMQQCFDTDPKDLHCAIGPSICCDCYEVDKDVADAFKKAFPETYDRILEKKANGKYQLDLWESNRILLQRAGVPENQIYVTDICTCCNASELFSHRASKGRRGNLGAFLMLTEND